MDHNSPVEKSHTCQDVININCSSSPLPSTSASIRTTSPSNCSTFGNEGSNYCNEIELLKLVKLLLKKVDALEDYVIKLDIKIDNLRGNFSTTSNSQAVPKLGVVDLDQLTDIGLPVESETELQKLDTSLKTDKDFKMKLVSQRLMLI